MSADNWAVCPRCKAREEARIAELDWEVGIFAPDLGNLFISYGGSCSVCGLEASHRHERRIYDPEDDVDGIAAFVAEALNPSTKAAT